MKSSARIIALSLIITACGFFDLPLFAASEPCSPPNIIPANVCDFDSFRGSPPRQIPNGWNEFILSGDPTYMQDVDTYWGPPSLRMWSNGGTFHAGIYTQVSVTPGAGYRASIAWGAPNSPSNFGRQLGIDPTGGTDPNSLDVIWGKEHFGSGRILNYPPPDVNIDVKARAVSDRMTVFFKVNHPSSSGDNLIFIDAIALYPDESAPAVAEAAVEAAAAEVAVAEERAAVPTEPPAQVIQPTNTPPPPTFTSTPTAIPTDTPTATPTPTNTATPTPTPTNTPTPTATWTPLPTVTPQQLGLNSSSLQAVALGYADQVSPGILVLMAYFGSGGALLFGSLLLWQRRQ